MNHTSSRRPECAEPVLSPAILEAAARHEERRRTQHYEQVLADALAAPDDEPQVRLWEDDGGSVLDASAHLVDAAARFDAAVGESRR